MPQITRLIVNKRQIAETRVVTEPSEPLADGQALFDIERFAFTANNISYAATGDLLQYWQFFPVDAQWGCVPTWGFASVLETRSAAVEVGERLWGFWPMASHVVMTPVRATAHGFSDGAAHRKVLPSVYNEYLRTAQDPVHTDGQEDVEALLRPHRVVPIEHLALVRRCGARQYLVFGLPLGQPVATARRANAHGQHGDRKTKCRYLHFRPST